VTPAFPSIDVASTYTCTAATTGKTADCVKELLRRFGAEIVSCPHEGLWHFSDITRCPTLVRSARKSRHYREQSRKQASTRSSCPALRIHIFCTLSVFVAATDLGRLSILSIKNISVFC
jgi:hypothetical protein